MTRGDTPRRSLFIGARWRSGRRLSIPIDLDVAVSLSNLAVTLTAPVRGSGAALCARAGDPGEGPRSRSSRRGQSREGSGTPSETRAGTRKPSPSLTRAGDREKALGPDHTDVAESLNSLASLSPLLGRIAEAEPLARARAGDQGEGLRSRSPRTRFGPERPCGPLLCPGAIRRGRACSSSARWRSGRRPRSGSPRRRDASWLISLCSTNLGRYAEAEPLYERALAIRRRLSARITPMWPRA